MDFAVNAPLGKANKRQAVVWFEGSTALVEGQGVCYNWDYGTAANNTPDRLNRVEVPTILNAPYFAGVADKAYSAVTGGQLIKINLPGSCCNIASFASTTIGVGRLTFEVGGTYAGYFRDTEGFPGQGSAKPLQTIDRSGTAGTCLAWLEDGPQSGGIERVAVADDAAIVCMVGGVTMITGGAITTGDSTFALVQGTYEGQIRSSTYEPRSPAIPS